MKIMVFLHGTAIMHATAIGKTREERVQQGKDQGPAILDFINYLPVENVVSKLKSWANQEGEICYLSSHEKVEDIEKDKFVIAKFGFPKGEIFYRQKGESYAAVAERALPDILIEDDCESIGGEKEMTYPHIREDLKPKIKSIVVKEFQGIDHLPDLVLELLQA